MNGIAIKDDQPKPTRSRSETKADITDGIARTIIADEANARVAKTKKIRQARLASEASNPEPEAAIAKPRAKAVRKSRAKA